MNSTEIVQVHGRQVWDSRGRPTVEAEVTVASGKSGRAIAPSGASKGSGEAVDLRDGNARFGGFGVTRAVSHVNGEIARALLGCDASCQAKVDQILIELDGTANKARLGGNAGGRVDGRAARGSGRQRQSPLHPSLGRWRPRDAASRSADFRRRGACWPSGRYSGLYDHGTQGRHVRRSPQMDG